MLGSGGGGSCASGCINCMLGDHYCRSLTTQVRNKITAATHTANK